MFTKVGILGFGYKRRLRCDTYRRSMNKSGNLRVSQIFIDHILCAKHCSRHLGGIREAGARGERAGGGRARNNRERSAVSAMERTDQGNGWSGVQEVHL